MASTSGARGRTDAQKGPNFWWTDTRPYVPVGVNSLGTCEVEKLGLKHMAVRGKEEESNYKPDMSHIAPRPKGWKPAPTNVQLGHVIRKDDDGKGKGQASS